MDLKISSLVLLVIQPIEFFHRDKRPFCWSRGFCRFVDWHLQGSMIKRGTLMYFFFFFFLQISWGSRWRVCYQKDLTLFFLFFFFFFTDFIKKNPAYGRHQLSQPMRIVGPIKFEECPWFFKIFLLVCCLIKYVFFLFFSPF